MFMHDRNIKNSDHAMSISQYPAQRLTGPTQLGGWFGVIRNWIDQSRTRTALANLDDRLLDDVGISRAQAAGEIAKPFWR